MHGTSNRLKQIIHFGSQPSEEISSYIRTIVLKLKAMSRATLANPPNFKVLIYRVVIIDTLIHKTNYDINSIFKCDFLAFDSGKLSKPCLRRYISTLETGVQH